VQHTSVQDTRELINLAFMVRTFGSQGTKDDDCSEKVACAGFSAEGKGWPHATMIHDSVW